jgi:hypothetical protein
MPLTDGTGGLVPYLTTDAQGNVIDTRTGNPVRDKWGNVYDPNTGNWVNSQGKIWVGDMPGTPGFFRDPTSSDITGPGRSTSTGGIDLSGLGGSGGGGGGGGSKADHFFDVNPLDQQGFDAKQKQQQWQNDFDMTQFNYQKAMNDRDYALALGDSELAKQKQASADYWQGKGLEVQQAMNAQDNQTTIASHQIDANAAIQSANIRAQADRYAAQTRLQEGLANAHNDEQRNQVLLAHERELANIAKMEDDTKRAIAGRQSQIDAFNGETTRAAQMGDLALKNNQFLMDNATNPRNLFGLYFMQRGLKPDWDAMAAGQPMTQGDALKPYDPMKAYQPKVGLPTDFSIGAGGAYGGVGSAANSTNLASNPFLNMNLVPNNGGGGAGGGGSTGFGGGGFTMPNFSSVSVGSAPQLPTDINKAGLQGGVPLAGLKPGMNLSTYGAGGSNTGADFTMPAYYDQGKTRAVGKTDVLTPGQQVWVDYQVPKMAGGGYTQDSIFMTGDAPSKNPNEGGARPEIIENPTNAPIKVNPNPMTQQDFGQNPNNQPPSQSGFGGGFGMGMPISQSPILNTAPMQQPAYTPPPSNGGIVINPNTLNQEQWGQLPIQEQIALKEKMSMMPPSPFNGNIGQTQTGAIEKPSFLPPPTNLDYPGKRPDQGPTNWIDQRVNTGPDNLGGGNWMDTTRGALPRDPMDGMVQDNRWRGDPNPPLPFNPDFRRLPAEGMAPRPVSTDYPLAPPINRELPRPMPPTPIGQDSYGIGAPRPDMNRWEGALGPQSQNQDLMQQWQLARKRAMMQQQPQQLPWQPRPQNGFWQGQQDYPTRYYMGTDVPRYALGTGVDASGDYKNAGLGNLWMGSSNNAHLAGQELPPMLRGLADYGVPISPSLAAGATGQIAPTLNTSSAFNQRGGGVLPSLQTFGNMTKGEVENFRGYAEGVVGMPWADIVDYLGKPTQNLGSAKQSQGLF